MSFLLNNKTKKAFSLQSASIELAWECEDSSTYARNWPFYKYIIQIFFESSCNLFKVPNSNKVWIWLYWSKYAIQIFFESVRKLIQVYNSNIFGKLSKVTNSNKFWIWFVHWSKTLIQIIFEHNYEIQLWDSIIFWIFKILL